MSGLFSYPRVRHRVHGLIRMLSSLCFLSSCTCLCAEDGVIYEYDVSRDSIARGWVFETASWHLWWSSCQCFKTTLHYYQNWGIDRTWMILEAPTMSIKGCHNLVNDPCQGSIFDVSLSMETAFTSVLSWSHNFWEALRYSSATPWQSLAREKGTGDEKAQVRRGKKKLVHKASHQCLKSLVLYKAAPDI